jgi:hypothetical protein
LKAHLAPVVRAAQAVLSSTVKIKSPFLYRVSARFSAIQTCVPILIVLYIVPLLPVTAPGLSGLTPSIINLKEPPI